MASDNRLQLPTRSQILEIISNSETLVGRREIARAFGLKGPARIWLRQQLKALKKEGLIDGNKRYTKKLDAIPLITEIEVSHINDEGFAICKLLKNPGYVSQNIIYLSHRQKNRITPSIGDRVLARIKKIDNGCYEASPLKYLPKFPIEIIGLLRINRSGATVFSIDRKERQQFSVKMENIAGAKDRDYVVAQKISDTEHEVKITERLGTEDTPHITSLLVLKSKNTPMIFNSETLALADSRKTPLVGDRLDLRKIPFVTIDSQDARDFDDAVWAKADTSDNNRGGWKLLIAIADVAHYVREGDALDKTARLRGNSVYCLGRVIPMLPEALSNGVCSLKPNEDRACIIADIKIDSEGNTIKKKFGRCLMRSVARLTYEQVQSAYDGIPDKTTAPLINDVIRPLYGAFDALKRARKKRCALELELPEWNIELNDDGLIRKIGPKIHLDSHRLIEEFMIAANVAAAEVLEKHSATVMYRIHEPPAGEKISNLSEALSNLGLDVIKNGKTLNTKALCILLSKARKKNISSIVNECVLRSQSQAVYGPSRLGHFGLGLDTYCHFTSPIRRYSDILVHRSLITALQLGKDGHSIDFIEEYEKIGREISSAERKAMAIEREVQSRLITTFMVDRISAEFEAQITGVTRHGLFVRLHDTGAEGFIPLRTLPNDWYSVDRSGFKITGERSGIQFCLGGIVNVKLVEAIPNTGSLRFAIVGNNKKMIRSNRNRKRIRKRHKRQFLKFAGSGQMR